MFIRQIKLYLSFCSYRFFFGEWCVCILYRKVYYFSPPPPKKTKMRSAAGSSRTWEGKYKFEPSVAKFCVRHWLQQHAAVSSAPLPTPLWCYHWHYSATVSALPSTKSYKSNIKRRSYRTEVSRQLRSLREMRRAGWYDVNVAATIAVSWWA